ncbi:MAG: nucleotidyl transferase AbiEii/AbiGii toxin family protein [Gammaproteobacteria bacterium]|nr:nucleotidyl transferase AbiEii/AbiGii toxin family protein [Gammaproteobacteria bacterium]
MRGLTDNQIRDIELVIRRRMIPLSAAMLEKDLLVRDVVAAVCRAGEAMGAPILFCGGTALSQAYSVIDRMSEDADFRIIVPATVTGQNGRRRFLSAVKAAIQKSLEAAGFPVDGEMKARNGNEYMMGQFAYRPAFAAPATHDEILRPHIKLEITAFTPLSPVEVRPLQTILDRIGAPQKEPPTAPLVPVVSIADTVADKIVGYLRRTAQDRAHLGRSAYDDRLVRHLYDVYAIRQRAPDHCPMARLVPLVAQVIARDQATYGNQFPAFRDDPTAVLGGVLESLIEDGPTERRYAQFCQSLLWGDTPSYTEVATAFSDWARAALNGESREEERDESGARIA